MLGFPSFTEAHAFGICDPREHARRGASARRAPGTCAAPFPIMRTCLLLVSLVSVASAAPPRTTPATNLAPIDLTTIPEPCLAIAKHAGAPNLPVALSARVSLASCLPAARLAGEQLVDSQDSLQVVEAANQPSLALLEEVTAAGDPTQQLLAEHTRGELYTAMAVRMMQTVPPPGDEASSALHASRSALLETMVTPWRDRATAAYQRVVELGKVRPELSRNPVVQRAIRAAKQRLGLVTDVAMR
jgi:hypothetical protein